MTPKRTLLQRCLPRYTAAFTAAATAAAGSTASGAIIVFDSSHAFNVNTRNSSHSWDIDNNGTNDFIFRHHYSRQTFSESNSTIYRDIHANKLAVPNAWVAANASALVMPLSAGATIGPVLASSRQFNSATAVYFTNNGSRSLNTGMQLVGFRFAIGGQSHYGWANVTAGNEILAINNWAYEGLAGVSIQAGAVPEPVNAAVGLGLLALGAAGVSAYKRKKKLAAA